MKLRCTSLVLILHYNVCRTNPKARKWRNETAAMYQTERIIDAIQLAINDHRTMEKPLVDWEFIDLLHKAKNLVKQHNQLLADNARLINIVEQLLNEIGVDSGCLIVAVANARALLMEMGEK